MILLAPVAVTLMQLNPSAVNRRTHQRGPEDTHRKSLAARVKNNLFGDPFGLAVAEVKQFHVLVEVGLIEY